MNKLHNSDYGVGCPVRSIAECKSSRDRSAALCEGTDPDWVGGYASVVEWREFDPRAAAAADRTEDALRWAGLDVPGTSVIQEANRQAASVLGTGRRLQGARTAGR